MIYDVIIIWAGASGLFSGICLDKSFKKLILEKTSKPWAKVLLSGWERANVTNMYIDDDCSYFSQNKKFLKSIFSRYNQWNFMWFCAENWIELVEEDNGRMILESWNSSEILDLFLKKVRENDCEVRVNSEVERITPIPNHPLSGEGTEKLQDNYFEIELVGGKKYKSKNVIVSSGGRSFFQVWTCWDGYNFAKEFWIDIVPTFPWLCGISTKRDLKELSGISCKTSIRLIDKSLNKKNKSVYWESWALLFTHFWLSWPVIFNLSVVIWEYLWWLKIEGNDFEKYLRDNLIIELELELDGLAKKVIKFFDLEDDENDKVVLDLHSFRSWKEAKITTGWVDLDSLDNHMQSKKYKGLFFVWEVVDVTGKTWGFNLQWAWSSGKVVSEFLDGEK